MSPPLRATAEAESSSSVSSLSVTIPASVQADDLIVIIAAGTSTGTFAALSGYTNVANERAGTAAYRLAVWYKKATGSEGGTSVTPTLSSGTGRIVVQCRLYHSVSTTTPMDATPVVNSSDTDSTNVPAGAITTVTANSWTVSIHGQPTSSGTTITSWTDPSGANNELISCSTEATLNQAALVSYDYDTGAAGTYGSYTAVSPQTRKWASVTLALRKGTVSILPTAVIDIAASTTVATERSVSVSAGVELKTTATVVAKEFSFSPAPVITLDGRAVTDVVQAEDLEITILAARDDNWFPATDETLVAKYLVTGDQRGWRLSLDADGEGDPSLAGRPMLVWSPDGTLASAVTAYATDRAPINPFGQVNLRVFLDVNNGAGGWSVVFEYLDENGQWSAIGDTVTGTPSTLINEPTADLTVGAYNNGTSEMFVGRVYSLQVRVGRTGEILASPDFTDHPDGTTTFTDGQGNTWTVHAPATLTTSQQATTIAMIGPLATDECGEWVDFTSPRSGIGRTCDHEPDECCSYYRLRTVGRVDGALLVSNWSEDSGPELFCLEWSEDEHLIRTTGPDGPVHAPIAGRFEWDVERPFTAATGINGTRFVTSASPGGRNLHMVAAVESEGDLATLRAILARPLVLISPSDSSEVWAAPVAESVRIVKIGRIRQITADFIGTGPEPGPQLADVGV